MVKIPPIPNYWILLLIVGLIAGVSIALFAVATYTGSISTAQHQLPPPNRTQEQLPVNTPISTPTPGVSTPKPTPTIPYKTIPRNATYVPSSRPLAEPAIDFNYTYTISMNPPFNTNGLKILKGTIFEVAGTTDLPVGSVLWAQAYGGRSTPIQKKEPDSCQIDVIYNGTCPDTTLQVGSLYVEPGCIGTKNCTTTLNTWRLIADSQPLKPSEYLVTISVAIPHAKCDPANTLIDIVERLE